MMGRGLDDGLGRKMEGRQVMDSRLYTQAGR